MLGMAGIDYETHRLRLRKGAARAVRQVERSGKPGQSSKVTDEQAVRLIRSRTPDLIVRLSARRNRRLHQR